MNKYVREFNNLRCHPDILACAPTMNKTWKEITESWSLLREVKSLILTNPNKYLLVDLCAGNCLTSLMAAHLLPVIKAYAVDIRACPARRIPRKFEHIQARMQDLGVSVRVPIEWLEHPAIIVASHSCGALAREVVGHYRNFGAYLALLPCCIEAGVQPKPIGFRRVQEALGKYESWCFHLAHLAQGDYYIDKNILSPARGVVHAKKEWVQ
jgi:hypothetical protein